jgi:hypothetical protein
MRFFAYAATLKLVKCSSINMGSSKRRPLQIQEKRSPLNFPHLPNFQYWAQLYHSVFFGRKNRSLFYLPYLNQKIHYGYHLSFFLCLEPIKRRRLLLLKPL